MFDPQASHWYNNFFWSWSTFSHLDLKTLAHQPSQKRLTSLRESILNWADRFRLTDEWCLDHILTTLYDWSHSEQPAIDWHYQQRLFRIPIDPERHFKFIFSAWHVDSEDWASYEKRLKGSFARTLLAYRDHQKERGESRKIIPARKKREMMHYRWLVDYHIPRSEAGTLSDSEIAAKYGGSSGLDRSTVYEAIHSTASLIGLTLHKH